MLGPLGRGLSSLIPNRSPDEIPKEVQEEPREQIAISSQPPTPPQNSDGGEDSLGTLQDTTPVMSPHDASSHAGLSGSSLPDAPRDAAPPAPSGRDSSQEDFGRPAPVERRSFGTDLAKTGIGDSPINGRRNPVATPEIREDISSFSSPSSPAGFSTSNARSYEDHFMPRRGESIFWIEIEKIKPNPYQPRREFNEESLNDLARSIREHGVLQPILVTKEELETPTGIDVNYQLIAGERRWRAAQLAGLSQIPAVIRRGIPDDRIKLELALIENVQREDLNAIERARAYRRLVDEFHLTQRDISNRIGKSREAVTNALRLLTLPEEIQLAVQKRDITEGHARAILMSGDDVTKQQEVYQATLAERLSVRGTENRARQVAGRALVPRKRPSAIQNPEINVWQQQLQERLGTKVHLHQLGNRGRIVVEFYSDEELRGIIAKLV